MRGTPPDDRSSWRPKRPGLVYRLMMLVMAPLNLLLGLSCRAFVRLVSDAFERPLTRGERFRRAAHRAMCDVCRVHERRIGTLREVSLLLARSTDAAAATGLSKEARARLERTLEEADVE